MTPCAHVSLEVKPPAWARCSSWPVTTLSWTWRNKPEGTYTRVSAVDNMERITAFGAYPDPLNMLVSDTTEAALEEVAQACATSLWWWPCCWGPSWPVAPACLRGVRQLKNRTPHWR